MPGNPLSYFMHPIIIMTILLSLLFFYMNNACWFPKCFVTNIFRYFLIYRLILGVCSGYSMLIILCTEKHLVLKFLSIDLKSEINNLISFRLHKLHGIIMCAKEKLETDCNGSLISLKSFYNFFPSLLSLYTLLAVFIICYPQKRTKTPTKQLLRVWH